MIVKFKVLQTLKNHMELMVEYGTKLWEGKSLGLYQRQ